MTSSLSLEEKEKSLNSFEDSQSSFPNALAEIIVKIFAELAKLLNVIPGVRRLVSLSYLPEVLSLWCLDCSILHKHAEEKLFRFFGQDITSCSYTSRITDVMSSNEATTSIWKPSFTWMEKKIENFKAGQWFSHLALCKRPVYCFRKKLIILDVNGLLAAIVSPAPKGNRANMRIKNMAVFIRPCCLEFLKFCFEKFEVGIWSSRSKKYLERVVHYMMGDLKQKLLFCWDLSYCTETRLKALENRHKTLVFKDLKKLWAAEHDLNLPWEKGVFNESNTLLLDDSPYKSLLNPPHSAIFPFSYMYQDTKDNSLGLGGDIRVYLENLAAADSVQDYVKQHPFGQNGITERHVSWNYYLKGIRSTGQ